MYLFLLEKLSTRLFNTDLRVILVTYLSSLIIIYRLINILLLIMLYRGKFNRRKRLLFLRLIERERFTGGLVLAFSEGFLFNFTTIVLIIVIKWLIINIVVVELWVTYIETPAQVPLALGLFPYSFLYMPLRHHNQLSPMFNHLKLIYNLIGIIYRHFSTFTHLAINLSVLYHHFFYLLRQLVEF